MYRKILELRNDTSILRKNYLFQNKICCALSALVIKTKIYFCRCNFGNKQITKIHSIIFPYGLHWSGRTQDIPKKVGSFGNGTPNQWGPIKNVPV